MPSRKRYQKLKMRYKDLLVSSKFPIHTSSCFVFKGIYFHVKEEPLGTVTIYTTLPLENTPCQYCKDKILRLVQSWKDCEKAFLFGIRSSIDNEQNEPTDFNN